LLDDFNDHLDLHAAETLSFDDTARKYHSHHSSTSMQKSAATHHSHKRSSKAVSSDYRHDTESLDGSKISSNNGRTKKRHRRERRGTSSSEKSTLSRSILTFNPFKHDKLVKPPNKSARLGVGSTDSPSNPKLTTLEIRTRSLCLGRTHAEMAS
jgi:hypothetical protein